MTAESPLARLVAVAEELGLGCELADGLFLCHADRGSFFVGEDGGYLRWWSLDIGGKRVRRVVETLDEAEDALRRWARGDG